MTYRLFGRTVSRAGIITFCLMLVVSGNSLAIETTCKVFDEFKDVNCEDSSARLDNFAVTLGNDPSARGSIIFYEGNYKKGRIPRFGEARANAERMKNYLVNSRGVDGNRIGVIDGGYRDEFTVQLYACPSDVSPFPHSTRERSEMKFRRGKILKRELKWSCLE